MTIEVTYPIGALVRLIHDHEHLTRMLTRVQISELGVMYGLTCGASDTWHYEQELQLIQVPEGVGFKVKLGPQ